MADVTITEEQFRELMIHTKLFAAALMHHKLITEVEGKHSVSCQLFSWTETLLKRHVGVPGSPGHDAFLELLTKQYGRYFNHFRTEGDDNG